MDGDTISPTNCVRQPFARSEIGHNKAIILVNRLNLFWGLKWEAVPAHIKPGTFISRNYTGDDPKSRGPDHLPALQEVGPGWHSVRDWYERPQT
jgi:hypothetical protein